jgi:hypothetical protein
MARFGTESPGKVPNQVLPLFTVAGA